MSGSHQGVFMNQRSFGAPPGQDAYTSSGTYSWVAPTGISSVSVVAIGGGWQDTGYGRGGGGGLGWKNNISVIPGQSYTVFVGPGGSDSVSAETSYFINAETVSGLAGSSGAGGSYVGDGGGTGGYAGAPFGAGGGAGGYSGNGGNAASDYGNGSGGSGGGGGHYLSEGASFYRLNGGGGAVRIIWGPNRAFPSTNTGDV